MAISNKITRWNMHELGAYERLQHQRERRALAAQEAQKSAAIANSFAAIRNQNAVEQGNLFSRIAMQRLSKRV
ncbi:MAG: hypothetical protein ABS75_14285 [Pelagibacterium sp. SCN 63-23]|nr:MAG: hypothetical protein ABS75_14285 [Pelagibacterium sp. SCN 63-23]